MTQTLFDEYNKYLKKFYGRTASAETFANFMKYCQNGVEINGIKPFPNPINLWAFGNKITSDEANELFFKNKEVDHG